MTVPISSLTDTWNSSGTAFTAIGMNVTNTASAAGSKLLDLQIASASKFNVDPSGNLNGATIWTDVTGHNVGLGNVGRPGSYSVLIGDSAGSTLTTGTNNTIIGANCNPSSLTSGSSNTIIGANISTGTTSMGSNNPTQTVFIADGTGVAAMWAETSGNVCVGIGNQAGNYAGHSGSYCISIGSGAGFVLTSGAGNVSIGAAAGSSITTGSNNIFIGSYNGSVAAGQSVTTGNNNTIIGNYAGAATMSNTVALADGAGTITSWVKTTSTNSAGFGLSAGNLATASGTYCVSIGYGAGGALTSGAGNTLVGVGAGGLLTTGGNNVFIGSDNSPVGAGSAVTTGGSNIIIGDYAGTSALSNLVMIGSGAPQIWLTYNSSLGMGNSAGHFGTVSGANNISLGAGTGALLTTGNGNVLIGTGGSPTSAGAALTTGSGNIFIGSSAGLSVTTGNFNTIVGAYTGASAMANQVVLADGGGNIVIQHDQPNKTFATPTTTVGTLPSAGTIGRRAFVTDANASTFFTVAAGSGSNKVPVFDDGTNWRIG